MGGTNPYISQSKVDGPGQKYTITYVIEESGEERPVEVDPAKLPYSHDGLPGSLLDIALGAGIDIDHSCGGVCACSTCHVLLESGAESCNAASEDEEDMLDTAAGVTDNSRLGCQTVPDGSQPMRVIVPAWNRNGCGSCVISCAHPTATGNWP